MLSEKFLEVFGWFETELENVQKIYESQKVIETCTETKLLHFIVIALALSAVSLQVYSMG